ncbi:MAG TPA: NUDIX domain-containing protein [Planktothrix sp.]|jgi:8-oxo-dGTP diphosphatase
MFAAFEIGVNKLVSDDKSKEHPHPRVGVGVLVVRGDYFLLGKRCGLHMPGYYAAPGGHLEHGETFAACAAREVLEETNLSVTNVRFLMIGNYNFSGKHYVDIDMVVDCPVGDPVAAEPDKCSEWKWYHKDELPAPLFVVTKRMIEAYVMEIICDDIAINQILQQA